MTSLGETNGLAFFGPAWTAAKREGITREGRQDTHRVQPRRRRRADDAAPPPAPPMATKDDTPPGALDGQAVDVTITSSTFAKVANYFVALQVNKGKKVRTEVSAGTEKPKFKKSQHVLELGEELRPDTDATLTLGAFVVLPSKSGGKGNARLLGSCPYKISDAAVRLLRGQTVPEDLTFVRKAGKNKEVVVGKISIAISLVGVGDAVSAKQAGSATRVVDVLVHGAHNVSAHLVPGGGGGTPATKVEARVVTPAVAKLIADYEKVAFGADGGAGEDAAAAQAAMEALVKAVPPLGADTRVKALDVGLPDPTAPAWNEIMSLAVPDREIKTGAVLRLDVVQSPCDAAWASLGGVSLPIMSIEAGHQYDLTVEFGKNGGAPSVLGVGVWARDSPSTEEALLKVNSNVHRLEVLLKSMGGPLPFDCAGMIAAVRVLSKEGLASLQKDIQAGFVRDGLPTLPTGRLPYQSPAAGPDVAAFKQNAEDYTKIRTLEKVSPAISPGTGAPRFDHSLLFDMGNGYGVSSYPDGELPAALFLTYFRSSLAPQSAPDGYETPPENRIMPAHFMGFSLVEIPETHPDDGAPQGLRDVDVVLLPPAGAAAGTPVAGPKLELITRMWSGATFLSYMKDGDPIGDAHTKSGKNVMQWLNAKSRLSDPEELTGMAKLIMDNHKKNPGGTGEDAKEEKEGEGDPFAEIDKKKKQQDEAAAKKQEEDAAAEAEKKKKKKEERKRKKAEKEAKEAQRLADIEESMRSESKMVPTMPETPSTQTIAAGAGLNASASLRGEANQKEVDELHKRLAVLTEDISHKQTLIDRLLKEVDKRSDAIRTCGVEIVQLRRKNKKLASEKDELTKQMKEMVLAEQREARAIQQATTADLSKGNKLDGKELAQRLHVMSEKYKTERERNTVIMQKLKTLYQQSAKVRHSQQHFAKLEKAHQAQAAYIQKLQAENQKIEVYKATIRTQERVVAKLEELIETKLRDRKDGGSTTAFRLKQEIVRLQRRNQELEKRVYAGGAGGSLAIERVKKLEGQLKAARMRALETGTDQPPPPEGGPPGAVPPPGVADADAGLPASGADAAKDAKIKALEEQMVANAKGFAAQISEYVSFVVSPQSCCCCCSFRPVLSLYSYSPLVVWLFALFVVVGVVCSLKLKLMEAEMGGGGSDSDDDDDDDDDSD